MYESKIKEIAVENPYIDCSHKCEYCKDKEGVYVKICVKTIKPIERYAAEIKRREANPTDHTKYRAGIDEH